MIKTISKRKLETILKIIDKYLEHITNNKDSLIARIYGIYEITLPEAKPIHFILMKNCVEYE